MNDESILNAKNYHALDLFTDGDFDQAADQFDIREYRCASLLNSGDRSRLIAEERSYEQRLYLIVARCWGYEWLFRKIASKRLSDRSEALHPWFAAAIRRTGRISVRRIGDQLIVPATADRHGEPSFISDQLVIGRLLSTRDFPGAIDEVQRSVERWGDRPKLRLDEIRIWRKLNRTRAFPLAKDLYRAYPNYFPGLKSLLEEGIERLCSDADFPASEVDWLSKACEEGMRIDPFDFQIVTARNTLRIAKSGSIVSGITRLSAVVVGIAASRLHQKKMLHELEQLYSALPALPEPPTR